MEGVLISILSLVIVGLGCVTLLFIILFRAMCKENERQERYINHLYEEQRGFERFAKAIEDLGDYLNQLS